MAAALPAPDSVVYAIKLELDSSTAIAALESDNRTVSFQHTQAPNTKIQSVTGTVLIAGYIKDNKELPVPVEIRFVKAVNGSKSVCFIMWQPSGTYVDHDLADAFIRKQFPKAKSYPGMNRLFNASLAIAALLK